MSRNWTRRTVVQAMGIGAIGGVAATTRRASAASVTLQVCGNGGDGGEYRIVVSDPNAQGVSSTLESSDGVKNGSSSSSLFGYAGPGDCDEFTFDGRVLEAEFTGAVVCLLSGVDGSDVETELDVFTADGQPRQAYAFGYTGTESVPLSNTESDDYDGGGYIGNGDLEDTFAVDGVVDEFDTNPDVDDVPTPTTDNYVGCVPRR